MTFPPLFTAPAPAPLRSHENTLALLKALAGPITSSASAIPGAAIGRLGVQQSQVIGLSLTAERFFNRPRLAGLVMIFQGNI